MHANSNNFQVFYVLKNKKNNNIDIAVILQIRYLRYYFWLGDHPILRQVSTQRYFQQESILECPVLDVRQIDINKKRKN